MNIVSKKMSRTLDAQHMLPGVVYLLLNPESELGFNVIMRREMDLDEDSVWVFELEFSDSYKLHKSDQVEEPVRTELTITRR